MFLRCGVFLMVTWALPSGIPTWLCSFPFSFYTWDPQETLSFFCALTFTIKSILQTLSTSLCFHSLNQCYSFPHQLKKLSWSQMCKNGKRNGYNQENLLYVRKQCAKDCGCVRMRCWGDITRNKISQCRNALHRGNRERKHLYY